MGDHPKRLFVIAFFVSCALAPGVSGQALPSGYQEYIVLGRDGQVFDFLEFVASAEGDGLPNQAMESVVTLTATLDGQMIVYDH